MTAQDLADRVGISRKKLHNIEKGAPRPEIGTVFEAAALAGVRLLIRTLSPCAWKTPGSRKS